MEQEKVVKWLSEFEIKRDIPKLDKDNLQESMEKVILYSLWLKVKKGKEQEFKEGIVELADKIKIEVEKDG